MMRRTAVIVLAVASVLGACGSDSSDGISGEAIESIGAEMPGKLLDLDVFEEDVKNTIAQAKDTYVEKASLFSLRNENLAVATLQITLLSDEFQYRRPRQRVALADKIGGSRSQPFRLGRDIVYLTQGQRQRIAVWFRGPNLFVLSSREDFARPRSLLRAALELRV